MYRGTTGKAEKKSEEKLNACGFTHPIHYEWLNGIHPNTKNTNAYGSTHPCITKISKVIRSRRATNVVVLTNPKQYER